MRVALRIAYDASAFGAYARDPRRRTVEGCLLDALGGEGYEQGSIRTGSRTDAGVSALENVLSVRLARPHLLGLVPAVQARLPEGLWLTGAAKVAESFRPRHARLRTYRLSAPRRGEDVAAMRRAAACLRGTHDVRAFARLEPGRDPRRSVAGFSVRADGDAWVLRVTGPSFLWHQVRRMVGAVLAVGAGEATPGDVEAALRTGRPHPSFRAAPAEGLVLERVRYDPPLRWDRRAGRLEPRRLERPWLAARSRLAVAEHLRGL